MDNEINKLCEELKFERSKEQEIINTACDWFDKTLKDYSIGDFTRELLVNNLRRKLENIFKLSMK